MQTDIFQGYQRRLDYTLVPGAKPGDTGFVDGTWRITFRGRKQTLNTAISNIIVNQDSINDFGIREYGVPNWFPTDGSAFPFIQRFLERLGDPIRYFRLGWSLFDHPHYPTLRRILNLDNGDLFTFNYVVNEQPRSAKVLILRTRYAKSINSFPIKMVMGI